MDDIILDQTLPLVVTTNHEDLLICLWHGSPDGIDRDEPALVFTDRGSVGVCLSAVDGLVYLLDAPTRSTLADRIPTDAYVTYGETEAKTTACAVCGEDADEDAIQIHEPLFYDVDKSVSDLFAVHFDCRMDVRDALEDLWTHSDVLMDKYL